MLLFYSLFLGHPLEGERTDAGLRDAQWLLRALRHRGGVLHASRRRFQPAGDIVQQYWAIYPQFLRDLFVHAFVKGIATRVRASPRASGSRRWTGCVTAWSRARTCKTTNFWDPSDPDRTCRYCGAPLEPPFVLKVGRRNLAVSSLATLRSDHLASGVDEPTMLGRTRQHPETPSAGVLHNVSDFAWEVAYPDGHHHVLDRTNDRAARRRPAPDQSATVSYAVVGP